MTVIAAALRELMAAGVTGDALVTAIERIEVASAPHRTPGALRQQRYRERHKASQSVTSDVVHIESSSSPSEIQKKKKKVSTPLANDWSPSDVDRLFAISKGWDEKRIDAEAERFRDHAAANGRVQSNWPAAWRNWVTSPYQKPQRVNGHGTGPNLMDAFDRLNDQAAGAALGAGAEIRDITPRGDQGG